MAHTDHHRRQPIEIRRLHPTKTARSLRPYDRRAVLALAQKGV